MTCGAPKNFEPDAHAIWSLPRVLLRCTNVFHLVGQSRFPLSCNERALNYDSRLISQNLSQRYHCVVA